MVKMQRMFNFLRSDSSGLGTFAPGRTGIMTIQQLVVAVLTDEFGQP